MKVLIWLLQIGFVFLALRYVFNLLMGGWSSVVYEAPFVPSSRRARRLAVKKVKMEKGEKLVELGSGDGKVSLAFAKKYPIEVVAIEKNRWLHKIAKLRSKLSLRKKGEVEWKRKDLFEADLREADVVYIYLLTSMIERLRPKLEEELKSGARVVSWHYKLESKEFSKEWEGGGWRKLRVYVKR